MNMRTYSFYYSDMRTAHSQCCNLACMGRPSPWPYRSQHILARHAALPGSLHSTEVMRIHNTCRPLRKAHDRKARQARVLATDSEQELRTAGDAALVQEAEPYMTHCWTWRDHRINYAASLEMSAMCTHRTGELFSCSSATQLLTWPALTPGSWMWASCGICTRLWSIHRALPEKHSCYVPELQGRVSTTCPWAVPMHLSVSTASSDRCHKRDIYKRFTCGQVYAIDLLGFGRSDKPLMSYSIELWTEQLLDFLSEFVSQPSILVGNSIGSLISLMVMASCSSRCSIYQGSRLSTCSRGACSMCRARRSSRAIQH